MLSVNEVWLDILLTPMRDQITVAETCRRCGISRQTFYVYQRRFYADLVAAVEPLSRRPRTSPAQTDRDLEAECVRLRRGQPPAEERGQFMRTSNDPAHPLFPQCQRFIMCCSAIHSSCRGQLLALCQHAGASIVVRQRLLAD